MATTSKHKREGEVVAAFVAFFDDMPARYQKRWRITYDDVIARGDSDVEASIAAWHDLGIDMLPHPSGVVRIDELRGAERADAGEWNEALHPRDIDGRFEGGGAGVASAIANQWRSRGSVIAKASTHVERAPTPDMPKRLASRFPDPKAGSEPSDYKAPDTMSLHQTSAEPKAMGGTWDARRAASVHQPYTDDRLDGVARSRGPLTVHMTGGGPASGKSTALLSQKSVGIPEHGVAAHINPDTAKNAIPEYRRGIAAGDKGAAMATHEESSHMAKLSSAAALAAGKDVVFDGIGDNGVDKLAANVQRFRDQGAKRVIANYATIDPEVALPRAVARAAAYGRVVPEDVFNKAHADVNTTAWDAAERGVFDEITVWDSDVPKGEPPIKVWSRKLGGPVEVHHPELFKKFKARAGVRGDSIAPMALTLARMYELVIDNSTGRDHAPYTDEEQAFIDKAVAELAEARKTNPGAHFWLPAE